MAVAAVAPVEPESRCAKPSVRQTFVAHACGRRPDGRDRSAHEPGQIFIEGTDGQGRVVCDQIDRRRIWQGEHVADGPGGVVDVHPVGPVPATRGCGRLPGAQALKQEGSPWAINPRKPQAGCDEVSVGERGAPG